MPVMTITNARILNVGATAYDLGSVSTWWAEGTRVKVRFRDATDAIIDLDLATFEAAMTASLGAASPVEATAGLGVSRTLAAGATSAEVALTSTCTRVSLVAVTADIAFRVGSGSQTAVATDHYISVGERLDIRIPAGSTIAAIRAGTVDATLRISELV